MSAEATGLCEFLEWDSAFFGCRIARVVPRRLDSGQLRAVLAWSAANLIDCVYFLADADKLPEHTPLAAQYLALVDVRITLEVALPSVAPAAAAGLAHIRPATENDQPALSNLARVSHHDSRFYADRHFDRARCDELFATWIEKSCQDERQRVLVAEQQGALAGYVACHRVDETTGQIGLIAVSPAAQGQSVGRTLVQAAVSHLSGLALTRAIVITQGSNLRAQRLYQAHGFRTSNLQLWYHAWLPQPDPFVQKVSV